MRHPSGALCSCGQSLCPRAPETPSSRREGALFLPLNQERLSSSVGRQGHGPCPTRRDAAPMHIWAPSRPRCRDDAQMRILAFRIRPLEASRVRSMPHRCTFGHSRVRDAATMHIWAPSRPWLGAFLSEGRELWASERVAGVGAVLCYHYGREKGGPGPSRPSDRRKPNHACCRKQAGQRRHQAGLRGHGHRGEQRPARGRRGLRRFHGRAPAAGQVARRTP